MRHRIGFTTITFKPALLEGRISLPDLFDWGREQGFDWVELRDFTLSFSEAELLQARQAAEACGLRVHYAWDAVSVHAAADRDRFLKGLRNAALFGPGTCSRVGIAAECIDAAGGRKGYSAAEFEVLTRHIREYTAYAEERGVVAAFENGMEPLRTERAYGLEDLLEAVPAMRMTLDIANTFNAENTGEPLDGPQFLAFVDRYKERFPYVHLKSWKDGRLHDGLLAEGEVRLADLFPRLMPEAWLCVELPMSDSPESGFVRVAAGLETVRRLLPQE